MEKSRSETVKLLNFNHIKHQGSRRPPGHPRQRCDEDPATDSATFCSRVSRASDCTLTYTRQNGVSIRAFHWGQGHRLNRPNAAEGVGMMYIRFRFRLGDSMENDSKRKVFHGVKYW